jgi:hypothetical protein
MLIILSINVFRSWQLHIVDGNLYMKVITFGIFVLVLAVIVAPLAWADNINAGVFSINSKPYGSTYGEWSAKWWQWYLPIPASNNPLNDNTGALCSLKQVGPVWFMMGSNKGPVVRDCTVPQGKALFIPTLTTECSYAEASNLHSESQLRSCAVNADQGGTAQISVDGVNLQSLQSYKVQSPLFNFTFPKDNIFGAPPGPTQAVSDGIFVILLPLAPGNHTIHASGVVLANPTLGTQSFATEATYHLVVK